MYNKERTLKEAREYVLRNIKTGVICPCCRKRNKRYKRTLGASMVYTLIMLYRYALRNGKKEWVHLDELLTTMKIVPQSLRGGDFAKLRHWGLIQQRALTRTDGSKRSGYYRITKKGALFVQRRIKVQDHKFIYNNKVVEESDKYISIDEALKNKFNYKDLMY